MDTYLSTDTINELKICSYKKLKANIKIYRRQFLVSFDKNIYISKYKD